MRNWKKQFCGNSVADLPIHVAVQSNSHGLQYIPQDFGIYDRYYKIIVKCFCTSIFHKDD